jgi:phage terminase Nu1 subunit (DNA packaging protein)
MTQTYSLKELSGLLGVHRNTVAKWLDQGCPFVEKADRASGKEWALSLPDVVEWNKTKAVEAAAGDTSKLDVDESRRRKLAAEAAIAELDLAERRGHVVRVDVVMQVIGEQLSTCRARLLALPTKAAPLMVPLDDMLECRDVLDSLVREALDELTGYDGGGSGATAPDRTASPADDGGGADEASAEADGVGVGGSVPEAKPRGKRRARTVDNGA